MDKTNCFFSCLQKLKQNNKEINEILNIDGNHKSKEEINRFQFNRNKINEFNRNAKDLVKSITDMKNYLLENRKDYINIYSPLLSLASMMTDRERDEIDEDVEQFIKICNEKAIKCLRNEVKRRPKSQLSEHQNNAIDLIEKYLKSVCDIHSQQKAIRIKRAVEKQRLLRLGNIVSNKTNEIKTKLSSDPKHSNSKLKLEDERKENQFTNDLSENRTKSVDKIGDKVVDNRTTKNILVASTSEPNEETYQQLELTKHEIQAFEEENQHLFKQMNSMSDEVKDIELKVIEIARLQEIFTDNVLKQEIDLNKLSDLTIASTENIRGGNQQLREAMKKNAGFRVWLLFFITTLAFTVLFLDWYND